MKLNVTEERMSNYQDASEITGFGRELGSAFGAVGRWAGGAMGAAAAWYAGRALYGNGLEIAGYLIALNGIWLLLPAINDILRHQPIEIDEVQSPQPAMVRLVATLIVVWFLVVPWAM